MSILEQFQIIIAQEKAHRQQLRDDYELLRDHIQPYGNSDLTEPLDRLAQAAGVHQDDNATRSI